MMMKESSSVAYGDLNVNSNRMMMMMPEVQSSGDASDIPKTTLIPPPPLSSRNEGRDSTPQERRDIRQKNVFSTGRRSSLMSAMKPAEFYEQKRLRKSSTISGSGGFWNDENDPRYNERGNKQQSRRLIRSATVNGRFQHEIEEEDDIRHDRNCRR